jgi:four helix bundle protein
MPVVIRTHRDLVAWKESMRLLADAYRVAAQLPAIERYGLAAQLRSAALSIPCNISEGFGRRAPGELRRFLSIAEGSLRELQTLLEAITLLEYLPQEAVQDAADASNRVGYLLHRFRQRLKPTPSRPRSRRQP